MKCEVAYAGSQFERVLPAFGSCLLGTLRKALERDK